jgi:COX assembly protein 2
MYALEECAAKGFVHRMFGGCNEAKSNLNKCLRQARLARQKENNLKAREKNEAVKKAWAEIDENS